MVTRVGSWLARLGLGAAILMQAVDAAATEEQWRIGAELGYAMIGLAEGTLGGFGAGVHATYGLTDAFNLRAGGDVAHFARPEPATYALAWSGTAGIEYVLDVLDWVPYVGATVGVMGVYKAAERSDMYLGAELPVGLGYQLLPELLIGGEFRYRLLLMGTDVGPLSMLAALAHAELTFGP